MSRTFRSREKCGCYSNVEQYLRRQRWLWIGGFSEDEERAAFHEMNRDGACNEGNARRDYRHHTNKLIRTDNRRKLNLVKLDAEDEDMQFADKHDGKFYAWCVW